MSDDRFTAAVAAEVLAASGRRHELLQSIVEVARAIFLAEAASIAMLDEAADQFVFEALAGRGEDMAGARFKAGQGVAGAVAQSGEALIIDDLSGDPRFARSVAERTGYVPSAMMVAPLLRGERTLGVLSVLDRGDTGRSGLQELGLLSAFADQAALALEMGEAAQRASALVEGAEDAQVAAVGRLVRRLEAADVERREAGNRLLAALDDLLAGS